MTKEKNPKSFKDVLRKNESNSESIINPSDDDTLSKLRSKVAVDLEIDKDNIKNEVASNCNKYHRYLELYQKENEVESKLQILKKRAYGKLYHKLKFQNNFRLKSKDEIEAYIYSDKTMIQIMNRINKCKNTIEYLDHVLQLFKMRGYALKELVDIAKLEAGGFI